ncbi:MAG: periplasmic heavy metal sensor [Pseudomonadota bacterium]
MLQALRRAPIWVRLVLILSIGINLAGAGLVIGATLRPPEARAIPFTAFGLRHVLRHLPEADLAPFREASANVNAAVRPIRQTLRADRDRMVEIIRAPDFDAAALRALFVNQRQRLSDASAISADMLVTTLEALPLDARQRFADAILVPRTRPDPHGRPRLAGEVTPPTKPKDAEADDTTRATQAPDAGDPDAQAVDARDRDALAPTAPDSSEPAAD